MCDNTIFIFNVCGGGDVVEGRLRGVVAPLLSNRMTQEASMGQ